MMGYTTVLYEKEKHVAILKIKEDLKGPINIISLSIELSDICSDITMDKDVRVLVFLNVEKLVFSIEKKVVEKYLVPTEAPKIKFYSISEPIAKLECPVIIAINGDLMGLGLELALAGDIRISATDSRFGLPHVKKGMITWDGGIQRLARIVGKIKAMEMILTGETIDSEEAFRTGIINKIVSSNELNSVALGIARELASKAPIALRYAKEAVCKGLDMTLEQGLRLEADLYLLLHTTKDRTAGVEAFRGKETPHFKGE
jgi:enoyl-CoA hydratase/carnithine racemase